MITVEARGAPWMGRWSAIVLVLGLVLSALVAPARPVAAQNDVRFFTETGFRVGNDAFWNYFQRRGGLRTFGYPISREFQLEGFRVQFFQRQVMQLQPDGSVRLINLLDSSVLPYTRMNGSTFPSVNQTLINSGPSPSDPRYAEKVVEFIRDQAPNSWNGLPVNFANTALSLVSYGDAFPNGEGQASLIPVINALEITGLPTSEPTRDPGNNGFVYQRFQRLILQYDTATNTTQALLLADYLKALMTGQNLPGDLAEQARGSKYYRQYDRHREKAVARPEALSGSDLTNAFEREDRPLPALDELPRAGVDVQPANPAVGTIFTVTVSASDDVGVQKLAWNAEESGVPELDQVHEATCDRSTTCVRSWTVVSRVEGSLTIRATATDTAGQTSDPSRLRLTVANTLQADVNQPKSNAKVGGNVEISGWAADTGAREGTGIQAVHVYLDGEQGQGFFLGAAEYGQTREDIATRLGDDRFKKTGFTFTWDTSRVTPGEHTINVYALSSVTGRWERVRTVVTVVARPYQDDPVVRVMEPTANARVSGTNQTIKGWAIDRNAPSGTGVDQVEVWLDGPRDDGSGVKLGEARYGEAFGTPATEFGDSRFERSGFSLTWNPARFRTGEHTLYVYAHSTHTDAWSLRKVTVVVE